MNNFWSGKRVFVTHPTSFVGSWLVKTLLEAKAQVFGFGEAPTTSPSLFDLENLGQKIAMTFRDMRDEAALREALQFAEADVVIHLGEIGLLTESGARPLETFSKAAVGTATLMELLRETASVRSLVVVSSDKVYSRKDNSEPLTEKDPVGPGAILPTAKLCAELIALSYRHSFFSPDKYNKHKVAIATLRLGSSIGGGDFTEQALIPQAVQSFVAGKVFEIRNPTSMRPWIHVQDQVAGLLALAEALYQKGPKLSPSFNLGPTHLHSVGDVVRGLAQEWGDSAHIFIAETAKTTPSLHGELNSDLARQEWGWKPQISLEKAIKDTIQWYKEFYSSSSSDTL